MDESSSLEPINDSLRKIAKEELGETDEIREEGIASIKEWIESHENQTFLQWGIRIIIFFLNSFSQFHFEKNKFVDDLSILWFLRACKFDIERVKSFIENHYSFRTRVTEWYADRDPLKPEILDLLNLG